MLSIFIRDAKDLTRKGCDIHPYVVVYAFGQRVRSRTIWRDGKNPYFGENLFVEMPQGSLPKNSDDAVLCVMHDSEHGGRDDLLGEVDLNLLRIKQVSTFLYLFFVYSLSQFTKPFFF